MIIHKPHLCTKMDVWTPKYNNKSLTKDYGEPVALMHTGKVTQASPVIIVNFPKAKHLQGQRFCIRKDYAMRHALGSNGKAPMFEVPMSHFESWETAQEVRDLALNIFED